MTASRLPNWTYQIKQIARRVYALHGVDKQGHIVDSVGTGLDKLDMIFSELLKKSIHSPL